MGVQSVSSGGVSDSSFPDSSPPDETNATDTCSETQTDGATDTPDTTAQASTNPEPVATFSQDGGITGEVAAAKGTIDGVDVAIADVSVKSNDDGFTATGGLTHMQVNGDNGSSASFDTFNFRGAVGTQNPDGSEGFGAGATANAVAVEGTWNFSGGSSVTGGLSVGVGAEASVGTRDIDHDGNTEVCVRVAALFFTVGGCLETPF